MQVGQPLGWLIPSTKNICGSCGKGTIVKTRLKGMKHMSVMICNNCMRIYKYVEDE